MTTVLRMLAAAGIALGAAAVFAAGASADTNTNSNTQTASNTAASLQSAAAVSGDAAAAWHSIAGSGDAFAGNFLASHQSVEQQAANQIAVGDDACKCFGSPYTDDSNSSTNSQAGDNSLEKAQEAVAASGLAGAQFGSAGFSGYADSINHDAESQSIRQAAIGQGLFPEPSGGGAP